MTTMYAVGDVVMDRDGAFIICIDDAEQMFIAYDTWLANEVNAIAAQASATLDELGEPAGSDYRSRAIEKIATFVETKLRESLSAQVAAYGTPKH